MTLLIHTRIALLNFNASDFRPLRNLWVDTWNKSNFQSMIKHLNITTLPIATAWTWKNAPFTPSDCSITRKQVFVHFQNRPNSTLLLNVICSKWHDSAALWRDPTVHLHASRTYINHSPCDCDFALCALSKFALFLQLSFAGLFSRCFLKCVENKLKYHTSILYTLNRVSSRSPCLNELFATSGWCHFIKIYSICRTKTLRSDSFILITQVSAFR